MLQTCAIQHIRYHREDAALYYAQPFTFEALPPQVPTEGRRMPVAVRKTYAQSTARAPSPCTDRVRDGAFLRA